MDKFELTEEEWLLANGIRGMTGGEFHIDYLSRAEERKAQIAKVKSFYEPVELEALGDEEILRAEDTFIEKARATHKELGRAFIDGEITYPEYEKKSEIAWTGYYKAISQATISKNQKVQLYRLKE